jgi:hypothetical protein
VQVFLFSLLLSFASGAETSPAPPAGYAQNGEESGTSPLQEQFDREKKLIEQRLRRKYYLQRKMSDERKEKARRLRVQQLRERYARQKFMQERNFRRHSLFGEHLQDERLREHFSMNDFFTHPAGGSARGEWRSFTSPSSKKDVVDQNASLLGELELGSSFKDFEIKIWNLARKDFNDSGRSQFLPYENWIAYKPEKFQVKLGMQVENWAMTEVFTPSDVFNSGNVDSQFEDAEKIGEPAISGRFELLKGYLSLFYMPYFVAPVMPSLQSRLNPLPEDVKLLDTKFYSDGELKGNYHPVSQYAFRYARKWGPADLSTHYIHHIDREQAFLGIYPLQSAVRPIFLPTDQWGVNGSVVDDEWIYKFDFVQRRFTEEGSIDGINDPIALKSYSVGVLGIERSFGHENGMESTGFVEYQKVLGVSEAEAREISLNQNDLMLGYRLAFNDLRSREVKAFVISDMTMPSELLWSLGYSQKLSGKFKVSGGYRQIVARYDSSKKLDDTDHVFLNLTYFF